MGLFGEEPAASPAPAMPTGFNVTGLPDQKQANAAYSNDVGSLRTALVVNAAIGAGCFAGFLVFRTFMPQYQLRRYSSHVPIRPPPMPSSLAARAFGWVAPLFTTSDVWMLHSAGLDALVMQKTIALLIQIFLPVALFGCALLMPLQLSEGFERGDSTFSRLTMANIAPRSNIMWAHWVCCLLFLAWTLMLLEWHFKQYVSLRQFYLRRNAGVNYWRKLHLGKLDGVGVHKSTRMAQLVDTARSPMSKLLDDNYMVPVQRSWFTDTMAWLTNWMGAGRPEDVLALEQELTQADGSVAELIDATAGTCGFSADATALRASASRGALRKATGSSPASGAGAPQAAGSAGPVGEGLELAARAPAAGVADETCACAEGGQDVEAGGAGGGKGDQAAGLGSVHLEMPGPSMVAPRWYSLVDAVCDASGRHRALTPAERDSFRGMHLMLSKPSVRYRKTVNTLDQDGVPVGVNAQQYAVLVTNVDQPLFPEFASPGAASNGLGAGTCGKPVVKYEAHGDVWMGERYKRLRDNLAKLDPKSRAAQASSDRAAGGRVVPSVQPSAVTRAPDEASNAAGSLAALEAVEKGLPAGVVKEKEHGRTPRPARVLWAAARDAVESGRVRALLGNEAFCLVSSVFSSLFPGDFDRVVPVINFREVDMLIRQWDAKMGQLEGAIAAAACSGKRQQVKPRGAPSKVDRIEWLRGEVARLEAAVLEARARAYAVNSTPSFFVMFRSQKAAAIAASCSIHPLRQQLFQVHPAPGPDEVNWQALWYSHGQRMVRGLLVTPFIVVIVMLPVSLLGGAMTQLQDAFCSPDNTTLRWDEYCRGQGVFRLAKNLLTGFVPALLVMLWQALAMPRLVFLCAQSEARHFSLPALDMRMGSIYFLWSVFNFFMGGIIGSTALSQVPDLINNPSETPSRLGYALPASAKFFLTYMILRTFMTIPLRFLIPQPGVWQAWIRMGLAPLFKGMREQHATERARFMWNAIRSPRYGVEFGGNLCLVMLIGFAFAVICPLVPLFSFAFFCGNWIFWRYQFLYNYQRKYESGGLFFNFAATRILVCAAIMIFFSGCVMIVKAAWAPAITVWVIGLTCTYAYYRRVCDVYMEGTRNMPLLVAQMAPRARVPSAAYVPPPLRDGGAGYWPEFNKTWEFLGMPGYSW